MWESSVGCLSPNASNSNNAWIVNGNNRNVNNNTVNNTSNNGVRPATFSKTKNFQTNIFRYSVKNEKLEKISSFPHSKDEKYVIDEKMC